MIWPFRKPIHDLCEVIDRVERQRVASEARAVEAERRIEEAEKIIAKLKARPTICCSFCSKTEHQVKKIIAGPTVFICNECVDLCAEIINSERKTA